MNETVVDYEVSFILQKKLIMFSREQLWTMRTSIYQGLYMIGL